MSQSPNQVNYLVFLEVVVIIAGFIFGLYQPLNKLKTVNQTLVEKRSELSELKTREQKLIGLRQAFSSQQKLLDKLNIAVPSDPQLAQALIILESIAAQSGVELTSLTPSDTVGENNQSNLLSIAIGFKANFNQLKDFFDLIDHDLRPISVDNLKVLAGQSDQGQDLSASLQLKLPYVSKSASLNAGLENQTLE